MKLGAYLGNQAHAPANSRAALISAYTGGAGLLHCAVRLTTDAEFVMVRDDDIGDLTGDTGRASEMTLAQLRGHDFARRFKPRGTAADSFYYFDPKVGGRSLAVATLAELITEWPRDVEWLIEVRPAAAAVQLAKILRDRGALGRSILALEEVDADTDWKPQFPRLRTALLLGDAVPLSDLTAGVHDLLVMPAGRIWRDGRWIGETEQVERLWRDGVFPLGVHLVALDQPELGTLLSAANGTGWAFGLSSASSFDWCSARPSYVHVDESFAGQEVDRAYFALGYSKANRYAKVSWDDGVQVELAPYDGPMPGGMGNPIERRLERLEWDLINVAKDWPYYSGGGLGLTMGISDDFAAEVSYTVQRTGQATTLEMAALNVDPGAHRASPPASFRDKDSFYDPHGAPPYVGVEHDEDDGFRINWNLGVEYDNNQYGRPVGDAATPRGARLRLERRGAYFAAYYRNPIDETGMLLAPQDWVCVGVARNDSMNRTVYLRCVGKRWRQEKADDPSEFEPIIPNIFVFRDLHVECFPFSEKE
ncbi:glycerophosphodiester phosphodiesterase [Massilia psychrophila]|uniref:GP-PDE domain-containing protein n=1 Tax=Massilia psychrophila TaxID=1603353 RepID=A0A2G8SZF4_9BURK|nr:glycerophosphodiester phosphodiesterase family protein [Massilia psychrophila]PIL39185.1 hypothetical protein CR103_13935 [Massilia psychrophila]GGE82276.1 hypothetical protein GCM10008020_28980 [Massilia psychrophila]